MVMFFAAARAERSSYDISKVQKPLTWERSISNFGLQKMNQSELLIVEESMVSGVAGEPRGHQLSQLSVRQMPSAWVIEGSVRGRQKIGRPRSALIPLFHTNFRYQSKNGRPDTLILTGVPGVSIFPAGRIGRISGIRLVAR